MDSRTEKRSRRLPGFICAAAMLVAFTCPAAATGLPDEVPTQADDSLSFTAQQPTELQSSVTINGEPQPGLFTTGDNITSGVTVNGQPVGMPRAEAPTIVAQDASDPAQAVLLVQRLQAENQRLTNEVEELRHRVNELQSMLSQPGQANVAAAPPPAVQPRQARPNSGPDAGPDSGPASGPVAVSPAGPQPEMTAESGETGAAAGAPPMAASAPSGPLDLSAMAIGGNPSSSAPPQMAHQPAAAAAVASASPSLGGAMADSPAGAPQTPQAAYEHAYTLVMQHDYPGAQREFTRFLSAYPSAPQTASAGYWLGETLYRQGDYKAAASRFLDTYKAFPKATKAPETLLMLGQSLTAMKQNDTACGVYDKMTSDFPKLSGPITSRLKEGRKSAGCS